MRTATLVLLVVVGGCGNAAATPESACARNLDNAAHILESGAEAVEIQVKTFPCHLYRDLFEAWYREIVKANIVSVVWADEIKASGRTKRFAKLEDRLRAIKKSIDAIPTGAACEASQKH